MKINIVDKIIQVVSPSLALRRTSNKAKLEVMQKAVRRYEGAGYGDRFSGFNSHVDQSLNFMVHNDIKNLVARSRNLSINNPYAKRAPKLIANNVIGTGIVPTPTGKKRDVDKIKEAWKNFGLKTTCDYNDDFNFYGLQKLIMRTVVTSGEALVLRKRVSSSVNKFGLQYLVLEGDYIDQTKHNYTGGNYINEAYDYYGIRFDKNNKKIGYWIYTRHPLEGNIESVLVDIKDVIHVYEVDRAGQHRGVPFASSTILKQRDLDDYEDAEVLGKKAASCMPIFVTNGDPDAKIGEDARIEDIAPGTVNYLKPGEQVTMSQPPQNPGFDPFIKTQHRAIANGYGITYEQLTGDLSNVNFSSGRMGWLEFQRNVDDWQFSLIVTKFCDKAFGWFLEACEIAIGVKASDISVDWTAPRREMIDPSKELKALKEKVRSGFASWSETVRELGDNPADVLRQLTEDQKAFVQAGLMVDSNPFFELNAKIQMTSANNNELPPNPDEEDAGKSKE
jgi:lambda family phage portal protein